MNNTNILSRGQITLTNIDDTYSVILTNEAQVIPTNKDRYPLLNKTYTTSVMVLQGAVTISDFTVGNIPSANGITVGVSGSVISFTIKTGTQIGADGGEFNIPITINGQTFIKTFSWSVSKQGEDGAKGDSGNDGKVANIISSSQIFKATTNGAYSPNKITLTPSLQNVTFKSWQYSTNGGSSWTNVVSGSNGLTLSGNVLDVANNSSLFNSTTMVIFKLNTNDSLALDTVSIAKLTDGAKGESGNDGADAKYVILNGEQTFKYSNNFTGTPTPTSIELTSTAIGHTDVARAWSYKRSGETTWNTLTGSTVGYTITHNDSNIWKNNCKSITVRCRVGETYDEITIVKVSDGSNGTNGVDGINGINSYFHVRYSANANGSSMTTTPQSTTKYIGTCTTTTNVAPTSYTSYTWALVKGADGKDGIAGAKGEDGRTTYLHIKYSNDGKTFTPNNGEDLGAYIGTYVDFTEADSTSFNSYTWKKYVGEDGTDGKDAYTVVLTNESHTFPCESNGNIASVLTATSTVVTYKGATVVTPTYGTITNPTGMEVTRSGNVLTFKAMTGSGLADSGTVTIPVIVDGKTFNKTFSWSKARKGVQGIQGATGATGSAGKDAITVILSNESHTFSANSSGNITTAQTTTSVVSAYKGATAITPTIGTLPTVTGLTLSKSGTTITIKANTGTSLADTGTFSIPLTVDGNSFTKVFSWTKVKAGATGATGATGSAGANAKAADILASSQVFKSTDGGKTFSPDTIKLTPKLQNVSYSNWQYSTNGGSTWTTVTSGSNGLTIASQVLTISKSSNLYTSSVTSVVFRLNTNDSSIYDTITIIKVYDVVNLTQTDIFNKLTNNGQTQGLYLENSKVYLNGEYIKAKSITADKVAIGDFTNLCQLHPSMNVGSYSVATVSNVKYFKIGQGAYAKFEVTRMKSLDFSVGDEYYISFKGYRESGVTSLNLIARYRYTDDTWTNAGTVSVLPNTSVGAKTATLKITSAPTSDKFLSYIEIFFEKDSGTNGYYYLTDVQMYRKGKGSLIVNGSITANMITSGTFKGVNFEAGGSGNSGSITVKDSSNALSFMSNSGGTYATKIGFLESMNLSKGAGTTAEFELGYNGLVGIQNYGGTIVPYEEINITRNRIYMKKDSQDVSVENGSFPNVWGETGIFAGGALFKNIRNSQQTTILPNLVSTSGELQAGTHIRANGEIIAQKPITSVTALYTGGQVQGSTFIQHGANYGVPLEIGQYIDMHNIGSTNDVDVRLVAHNRQGISISGGADLSKTVIVGVGSNDKFIHNNTANSYLQMKDNGELHFNSRPVMTLVNTNGYMGMATSNGADNFWIRTTTSGLIPYKSGGGGGSIGTDSWWYDNMWSSSFRAKNNVQIVDAIGTCYIGIAGNGDSINYGSNNMRTRCHWGWGISDNHDNTNAVIDSRAGRFIGKSAYWHNSSKSLKSDVRVVTSETMPMALDLREYDSIDDNVTMEMIEDFLDTINIKTYISDYNQEGVSQEEHDDSKAHIKQLGYIADEFADHPLFSYIGEMIGDYHAINTTALISTVIAGYQSEKRKRVMLESRLDEIEKMLKKENKI